MKLKLGMMLSLSTCHMLLPPPEIHFQPRGAGIHKKNQSHGNVMIAIPFQHSLLPYANAKTDLPRIHAVMVADAGYLQFGLPKKSCPKMDENPSHSSP
jgi:hypothetical protein